MEQASCKIQNLLYLLVKAVSCQIRLEFTVKVCSYVFSGGFTPDTGARHSLQALFRKRCVLGNLILSAYYDLITWSPSISMLTFKSVDHPSLIADFEKFHSQHLIKSAFSCFHANANKKSCLF